MTIKSKGGAAMKKSYDVRKRFGRKNMVMCLVALILVMITVVGTSYSWIEEVSKVEFNSDNGQETPYKMKAAPLNAEANIVNNSTEIDFSKYFNEGGDMHLSPCYSDGEKFYFPVNNTSGSDKFRLGTKDDANTNYISSTFKVKAGSENTAFWFEKIEASTPYLSLKTSSGANATVSASESYLRFSVTVDGATNVYCLNSTGKYNTVSGNPLAVSEATGRRLEAYAYYDPDSGSDLSQQTADRSVTNQNSDGNNLHCNTLFTVPKGQTKVVTVKIWLECIGSGSSRNVKTVSVSDINFRLTSSWAKMRRIYVLDRTISQDGFDNLDTGSNDASQWLASYGSTLSWGLKSNLDTHFDLVADGTQTIGGKAYKRYYADIPSVYNGADVVFFRCGSSYGTGDSDKTYTANGKSKHYRNMWETTFPNTFHNETFSVYSDVFGTWESVARYVKILNSCDFNIDNKHLWGTPYAYMWDSSTDIPNQANQRVVENATWPGLPMTKLSETQRGFEVFAFYYNSIYDRVVFNDNHDPPDYAYQTEDINLDQAKTDHQYYVGKYYDIATQMWYNSASDLPTYSDCALYGDFSTGSQRKITRFTNSKNGASNTNQFCRIYIKASEAGNYTFKVYDFANNNTKWWGAAQNSDIRVYVGSDYTLTDNNSQYAEVQNLSKGLYNVWWKPNDKKIYFEKVN